MTIKGREHSGSVGKDISGNPISANTLRAIRGK